MTCVIAPGVDGENLQLTFATLFLDAGQTEGLAGRVAPFLIGEGRRDLLARCQSRLQRRREGQRQSLVRHTSNRSSACFGCVLFSRLNQMFG